MRYDELLATPLVALARLRNDLKAFGVATTPPMPDAELIAWLVRFVFFCVVLNTFRSPSWTSSTRVCTTPLFSATTLRYLLVQHLPTPV